LSETIRWTNSWVDGDNVRFDTLPLQVIRNGEPQDFEGKLPSATSGINYLQMSVVTGDSDNIETLAGTGTVQDVAKDSSSLLLNPAQSIVTTTAGTITQVQAYVSNLIGLGPGTSLRCSVRTDNSGNPGTLVGDFFYYLHW